jgi:hypothetical protein
MAARQQYGDDNSIWKGAPDEGVHHVLRLEDAGAREEAHSDDVGVKFILVILGGFCSGGITVCAHDTRVNKWKQRAECLLHILGCAWQSSRSEVCA